MTKMPIFSIIVPCYNCQAYILETLDSLALQSFKDFEVICIDDGSCDNTLDVLYTYKDTGKLLIKVFHHENHGVSYTRNRGIIESRGKFILFLDADDVLNRDTLSVIQNRLAHKDFDTVFFKYTRSIKVAMNFNVNHGMKFIEGNQIDAMFKLLYKMDQYSFACFLYKKEILNRFMIRFDENTKHFEDREFNWKYLCHCSATCWIDAPLYGYRVNRQSVTNNSGKTWNDDGIKAATRVAKYLEENNCHFSREVNNYLVSRVLWAKAKSYSIAGNQQLFLRLSSVYDLKKYFKKLIFNDKSFIVSISSVFFIFCPNSFYIFFSFLGNILKRFKDE